VAYNADASTRPHRTATGAVLAVLLLVAIAGPLLVSTYARATPQLWGFPFFYWFQLIWIPLSTVCTALACAPVATQRWAPEVGRWHMVGKPRD
jgi:hypothetical protein